MKLFGEYLVEKEVISKENLAHALVEQIKKMPSTAEVVFDQKMFDSAQLLSVLRRQNENKTGFIEASIDLGLWSSDIASKIETYLANTRTPLGQILVGMGFASLQQITYALDDFLGAQVTKVANHQAKTPEATVDPVAKVAPEVSGEKELSSDFIGGTDLKSFCELFDPDLVAHLELSEKMENLKEVIDEIHGLKGAARLFRVSKLELFLSTLEEVLTEAFNLGATKINDATNEKLFQTYQSSIKYLLETQAALANAQTEDEVFSDAEKKAKLHEKVSTIELLKFDLSFL